jgi:hypothetical protein
LKLFGNKITESGYSHLQHLDQLNTLDLENANISEDAQRQLAKIPHLKSLQILNCNGFHNRIDGLKQLRTLSELSLDGVDLAPSALPELQAALPSTKVSGAYFLLAPRPSNGNAKE